MTTQDSTAASPTLKGKGGQAVITQIESSRLLPWLMLTSILSGFALAASTFAIIFVLQSNGHMSEQVRIAEREARVASERYNDIKVELVRRGIPVSDH